MFTALNNTKLNSLKQHLENSTVRSWAKRILLGSYILCVLGFSMTSRAEVGHFPMPAGFLKNMNVVQLNGILIAANDGHSAMLVDGDVVVAELQLPLSSKLNFVDFHNMDVRVVGAVAKTTVQPIVQGGPVLASAVVSAQKGAKIPTVFVINISGSSN